MDTLPQAHERLLKDSTIQFRFPAPTPAPEPPHIPEALVSIGPWAFWVVVAVLVLVLLAVCVQAIRSRGLPRVGALPSRGPEPAPQPFPVSASVLADADALARAGAYGEAVHALLLRGVGAIRERFPRALTPAHTSRDIAALAVLPPALAQAFAAIAAHTERAVFAQIALGREDWDTCRALYAGMLAQADRPHGA